MPRIVSDIDLILSGEKIRIRTNAGDQLNAERATGRSVAEAQVEMQFRAFYSALRRREPGHPAAKDFRSFMDMIEAYDEVEVDPEDPAGLDPTQRVDSEG